ncbi:MAG: hypothetical protein U0790_15925 [Isosphaeraceae bacterium]
MNPSLWLAIVSALFLLTWVGITVKQRRAASCPKHRHSAGMAAQFLALACLLIGVLLAGMAVYPWLTGRGP